MKRVLRHILFWSVYLAQDTYFAFLADAGALSHYSVSSRIFIALEVCVGYLIPKIILTYFLLNVMLVRILKQKEKLKLNIFYTTVAFVITLFIYRAMSVYLIIPFAYGGSRPPGKFFNGVSFLFALMDLGFVTGMATAIKMVIIQLETKDKEKMLIKEKLETELKYLKNQTNPHFLFNTLNNIYALARKKSDHTADVVMKLSKILRFMLYETDQKLLTIGEEVRLIEDYLDLEKIRYSQRLKILFTKEIADENKMVSPLLLLPFIENAFKHGAGKTRFESFINIQLKVSDSQLTFEIENSKEEYKDSNHSCEQIGLMNIQRQLELLYGDYQMDVMEEKETFSVSLHVNLNSYGKV